MIITAYFGGWLAIHTRRITAIVATTEEECGALDTSDLLSMIDCVDSLDEIIIEAEELLKAANLPYHANDGVEIGY